MGVAVATHPYGLIHIDRSMTRTQKPVGLPENLYRFPAGVSFNSIQIFFWYRNLVRVKALLNSVKEFKETGTGFLVLVSGRPTGFWIDVMGLKHVHETQSNIRVRISFYRASSY